jgi:branched-chain amino acid transport system permease protein
MNRPTSVTAHAKAAGLAVLPLAAMVLFVKVAWPDVTWGVILGGTVDGLLTALVALGIAIVYRANRIINFAAADLGETPAILALLLYSSLHWNIYLATLTGLVASIVLGVLVEFLFLRRFFRAPRLILTVATIGVTEVVVALGLLLPLWLGNSQVVQYPPFINLHFTIGSGLNSTKFFGNDVLTMIVVPLILLGLVLFFRFTSIGIALRASAENADRASLLGIPVRRLQSVVWGLAAFLAFVAMFLRIGVDGSQLGQVLDPTLLLSALGAAVIGRMERLPTIVCSAIGLGIVSQGARFHYSSEAYRSVIIAIIIAIALLSQRSTSLSRLKSAATSTWQETREVRAIPAELRREPAVRIARWVLGSLLVLMLVLIPFVLPGNRVELITVIAIYSLIGLSLVVLTGWAGQVSLGQMAFVGFGSALAGTMCARWHVDTGIVLLASGALGAVLAVIVGMPTLRARGLAFPVITLAFALATSDFLLNTGYSPLRTWLPQSVINRTNLFGVIPLQTNNEFYVLSIVVLALAMFAVRGLRATRTGRLLIGVRDNERATEAYAIRARNALMLAFAISGFLAGVAGALFVIEQQLLVDQTFTPDVSLRIFAMVVVGGLGSISGAALGAIFVYGVQYFLPAEYAFLATGAGLLLVLILVPGGLGAMFGDARDGALRWYARRKGIRVPSLLADTLVERELPAAQLSEALEDAVERGEALPPVTEEAPTS